MSPHRRHPPNDDSPLSGDGPPPPGGGRGRRAPAGARPLMRLYGNLAKSVERRYGTEALGAYLVALRTGARPAPVGVDGEIVRWLRRMGELPPHGDRAALGNRAEEFIRTVAETVGRTPVEAATMARLFVAGLPGSNRPPVCGGTPQCAECLVTRDCDYHNAPARPVTEPIPPLKRMARDGASTLSDEELVAILVGGGRAGERDVELVRELFSRYGTLRALFSARFGELTGLRAVTETMAARLAAVGELHGRVLKERRYFGPTIRCGQDFYDLYHPKMRELKKEVFMLVMLDQRARVVREEILSEGTLTYTLVHPREVFRPAIIEAAAMVALVHNHPSGESVPSGEDIAITRQLADAAEIMEIPLLDHVVIGEGGYTSMVELDIIKPPTDYRGAHGQLMT